MTITWTKCSERMPQGLLRFMVKVNGKLYDSNKTALNFMMLFHPEDMFEWAPCTPEAWAESTNPDKVWLDELPEFLKQQAD